MSDLLLLQLDPLVCSVAGMLSCDKTTKCHVRKPTGSLNRRLSPIRNIQQNSSDSERVS